MSSIQKAALCLALAVVSVSQASADSSFAAPTSFKEARQLFYRDADTKSPDILLGGLDLWTSWSCQKWVNGGAAENLNSAFNFSRVLSSGANCRSQYEGEVVSVNLPNIVVRRADGMGSNAYDTYDLTKYQGDGQMRLAVKVGDHVAAKGLLAEQIDVPDSPPPATDGIVIFNDGSVPVGAFILSVQQLAGQYSGTIQSEAGLDITVYVRVTADGDLIAELAAPRAETAAKGLTAEVSRVEESAELGAFGYLYCSQEQSKLQAHSDIIRLTRYGER